MIPRLIHHIWIGAKPIPDIFSTYIAQWKAMYPDFNFILWDDELVRSTKVLTGESADLYHQPGANIGLKADLLRFNILERFGGLYVDTDNEPLKRMPAEFFKNRFFAGYQPNGEIAIGLMGSIPNEILVAGFINAIFKKAERYYVNGRLINLEGKFINEIQKISGPTSFTEYVDGFLGNAEYAFYESPCFYPYSWTEMHRQKENFKQTSPESYSVHHWAKSWE